ncbi:MAG: GNAT family N-acetyltransferase [Bacteroidetes bacterium]|nr:MAG: GNAT family N-acetyltransferase [Bacteroidota bacterium]
MIQVYPSPEQFLHDMQPLLEKDEAATSLILGLSMQMQQQAMPHKARFFGLLEGRRAVGCAMQTAPDKGLLLWARPHNYARFCVEMLPYLVERAPHFPKVLGPEPLAADFATAYARSLGMSSFMELNQGVYRLDEVALPPAAPGRLRTAQPEDLLTLTRWTLDFAWEAMQDALPRHEAEIMVAAKISRGQLYVWENGQPVCMAGFARPTRNGVSIHYVYTPPPFRGRGYASNCVALLSQYLLHEQHFAFCTLFTDLNNPISNHIYQKMGYRQIAHFATYALMKNEH